MAKKTNKFSFDSNAANAATTNVATAYDSAKKTYLDMLPALKPRYDELYSQIAAEKDLAAKKNEMLSGTESTTMKDTLARRGIDVNSANPYFAVEDQKLQANQGVRQQETDLGFNSKKLDVTQAEAADTRDINTAVANIDLDRSKVIQGILDNEYSKQYGVYRDKVNDKQAAETLKYQKEKDNQAKKQWEQTFAYTKSKDASDKAMELYKIAQTKTDSKNNSYNDAISSLVSSVYTGQLGSQEGLRENLRDQLLAKFPGQKSQIENDVYNKFFPNGFESRIPQAKGNNSPEVQKIMDGLGVDSATATKLLQQKLGVN